MRDVEGEAQRAMRVHLGVMLGIVVLWQAHVAWIAWKEVPLFGELLNGLNAELPSPTRFVLSTYRAWGVIPVATAVFAIDLLRRPRASLVHSTAVLAIAALVAGLLQMALTDALLMPFLDVLRKVA
jgi:type II secretory pathway component PulF